MSTRTNDRPQPHEIANRTAVNAKCRQLARDLGGPTWQDRLKEQARRAADEAVEKASAENGKR